MDDKELTESVQKLLIVMQRLDEKIAPMLEEDGEHFSKRLVIVILTPIFILMHLCTLYNLTDGLFWS